jgi:hypothetical protein
MTYLHRPIDTEGRLITPSDLRDHRRSHQFLGPCCMCPLTTGQPAFVEAAIYMATSGRAIGEYIVECAMGKCGYISKLLRYLNHNRHLKITQMEQS